MNKIRRRGPHHITPRGVQSDSRTHVTWASVVANQAAPRAHFNPKTAGAARPTAYPLLEWDFTGKITANVRRPELCRTLAQF